MFRVRNCTHRIRQPDGQIRKRTMWVGGRRLSPGATTSFTNIPTDAEPHVHDAARNPYGVLVVEKIPDIQGAPGDTQASEPQQGEAPPSTDGEPEEDLLGGGEADGEIGEDPEKAPEVDQADTPEDQVGPKPPGAPGTETEEPEPGTGSEPDPDDAQGRNPSEPSAVEPGTQTAEVEAGGGETPPQEDVGAGPAGSEEHDGSGAPLETKLGGSCEMPYQEAIDLIDKIGSVEEIERFTEGESRVRVTRAIEGKISRLQQA